MRLNSLKRRDLSAFDSVLTRGKSAGENLRTHRARANGDSFRPGFGMPTDQISANEAAVFLASFFS
jgi:hypothetical protein